MKMKNPTNAYNASEYEAFDVVLVPFPFIDSSQAKRRPALILSSSAHFNHVAEASLMAMITSKTHSPWPLDVEIVDLNSCGLPVKSIVRMKFFTLTHSLIIKKLGKLAHKDQKAISTNLKRLLPHLADA